MIAMKYETRKTVWSDFKANSERLMQMLTKFGRQTDEIINS